MPSADQVPVKTSHSTMHWHEWVVLIAGSTGSALRAVRSSNLHIAPDVRRDLVLRRKRDGLSVTLALSHHGPGHSDKLVGSATEATLAGRRADSAVSQGRCLVP